MICPHCKQQVNETNNFCPNCGTHFKNSRAQTTKECFYCHRNIPISTLFCPHCRRKVSNESSTPVSTERFYESPSATPKTGTNGFAIAGFVLSFFFALLGLIFSGIGIAKAKETNGKNGLAVAGLILSILSLAFEIILIVVVIAAAASDPEIYALPIRNIISI